MSTPLTYSIEQAAERIGYLVTVDWLKKHLDQIPHAKSGEGTGRAGRIAFTDDDLREIVASRSVRPAAAPMGPITRRRAS